MISRVCSLLGIGNHTTAPFVEPRMVGLAGPGGAGKSTVASMVIRREDVRASFPDGVLWLPVGQRAARDRRLELMTSLAGMVYETVLRKRCRPLRKGVIGTDDEDPTAYIQNVLRESGRRSHFLVVADDVWQGDILTELERAGAWWVLYTSRNGDLLPRAPAVRLDQLGREEAEMVLRNAADLANDACLPDAAYDLMRKCGYAALDLDFVGRWSKTRGRTSELAWRAALDCILDAHRGGEGRRPLSWRAAVLHTGLEELAGENSANRELYLALAVIPRGQPFPPDVAVVLLYGDRRSGEDQEVAKKIFETLERWSIITRVGSGWYRVHDEHADFIQTRFAANQYARSTTLSRWRGYMSSVSALVTFSHDWLSEGWGVLAEAEGEQVPSQPYLEALVGLDRASADRPVALRTAALFYRDREKWSPAYDNFSQLLAVQETTAGVDSLVVARTVHNLGLCVYMAGRAEKAVEYLQRALRIQEEKLGFDHPELSNTIVILGVCFANMEKPREAEHCLRRAYQHRHMAKSLRELEALVAHALAEEARDNRSHRSRLGPRAKAAPVAISQVGLALPPNARMGVGRILHDFPTTPSSIRSTMRRRQILFDLTLSWNHEVPSHNRVSSFRTGDTCEQDTTMFFVYYFCSRLCAGEKSRK